MTWSKIIDLGTADATAGLKQGTFFPVQRSHDEAGSIQISTSDHTAIASGNLFITGRPNSSVAQVILITQSLTALGANTIIISDIPLMPEMAFVLAAASASPTVSLNVLLME